MNFKRLAKHFPELAALEPTQQEALLKRAYQDTFATEHKMKNWRTNLISALIMTALCFFFALVLRPALGMTQQTSALILMVAVLPAYFFLQHRRFINQIRVNLQKHLP